MAECSQSWQYARVAVNFLLTDAFDLGKNDPLGRTWSGWRRVATADELWEANRGLWTLTRRFDSERIATLSYDVTDGRDRGGRIQAVAEITGRTRYEVDGRPKWALSVDVLRPGDPWHDALMGQRGDGTPGTPVGHIDTTELELTAAATRASVVAREPVTMLLTWNPDEWPMPDYAEDVEEVEAGAIMRDQWSTGGRRYGIEPDDRVFFLRQGVEPRGIIGSGTAASRIFRAPHWSSERADSEANYVLIDWDTLVVPEDGIPHAELIARIPEYGPWRPQSSGNILPPTAAAKLELLWAEHLGLDAPHPPRTTPRQGWQLDPVRRKKVEGAAQDRLMDHYRAQGWRVKDTRHGNPYDATATEDGRTLWLEAKGTETAGTKVIVTRGEVEWARDHLGDCVLGILSDVAFLPNGEVDPTTGTFRIFDWNPDAGRLEPRDYDFTPADPDKLV
jgi:hypothetical protein